MIRNRTKKPLAISLKGVRKGVRGRYDRGKGNNVQSKPNQHCHYKSPL
jgi:hypothetical protein